MCMHHVMTVHNIIIMAITALCNYSRHCVHGKIHDALVQFGCYQHKHK